MGAGRSLSLVEGEHLYLLEQPRAGHVPYLVAVRGAPLRPVATGDPLDSVPRPLSPHMIDQMDWLLLGHLRPRQCQVLGPQVQTQIAGQAGVMDQDVEFTIGDEAPVVHMC